jgi:diguanylate cyclase (GGDEF)-like protein
VNDEGVLLTLREQLGVDDDEARAMLDGFDAHTDGDGDGKLPQGPAVVGAPVDMGDVDLRSAPATPAGQNDRDRSADVRDQTSEARDDTADARDASADARDQAVNDLDSGVRERADAYRDRLGSSLDRAHAADDRDAAGLDRAASAGERALSSIDGLTGVHSRDAGMLELAREVARAKRTGQSYVVAFADVDGLKKLNDTVGHAAGDRLLRQIADTIRTHLRTYDLIVRFGGDEFVCGILDLGLTEAAKRFELVNADITATQQASLTVGLAQLEADDAVDDAIRRADQAMYSQR